jgi:hypothetical protein
VAVRTGPGEERHPAEVGSQLVGVADRPCLEEDPAGCAFDRRARSDRVALDHADRTGVGVPHRPFAAPPLPSSLLSIPCGSL